MHTGPKMDQSVGHSLNNKSNHSQQAEKETSPINSLIDNKKGEENEIDCLIEAKTKKVEEENDAHYTPKNHENKTLLFREDQHTPEDSQKQFNFWKLPAREKIAYARRSITVEPMLALFIIPSMLSNLATQNLNLEKACRVNLRFNDEVCDALSVRDTANYAFEESEVQKLTAGMAGWKMLVQSSLPAVLILFVGNWSDRHGRRKPCMLLPIVGEFCTSIGLLVCTFFYYELPIEAATFVEAVFPAMTGGWCVMFMSVFTYISDVTTEEDRTFRIGVVNIFFSIGMPIGIALSGILYQVIGFYGVFGTASCMYMCSFWYGYTQIHEEPKAWPCDRPKPKGILAFLADFFDVRVLSETFNTAFKNGEKGRRLQVILLMLVALLLIGPVHGETTVAYLFVRRKWNWDELEFSIFSTYCVVLNLIGTLVTVGLFSAVLKFHDSAIGMIACASKISAALLYAFSTSVPMVCFAPILDMMSGTSFITMRALASKLVANDELGKVNSLFGVGEALMPVVCGPLYSKVYQMTVDTLPGTFLLLSAGITLPVFGIFGWYYYAASRENRLSVGRVH